MTKTRNMQNTPEDLKRFQACFNCNGGDKNLASLRWQYFDNPVKKLYVDFEVEEIGQEERLAAIYAVFPVWFKIGSRQAIACQSIDTMTDSRYRGKGLFIKLAQAIYERCSSSGIELVYGFPNGNSFHGFGTKLDWRSLDPLPFLLLPLRSRFFLRKIPLKILSKAMPDLPLHWGLRPTRVPEGVIFKPIQRFDDRVDKLWKEFAENVDAAVIRDSRFLNWRFIDKPDEDYKVLGAYAHERLLGVVIYTIKEKHGGRIGYIMELLHDPLRPDLGEALLAHVKEAFILEKVDAALAWCFKHSPNYRAHRAVGFISLPYKLRPIELHMGFRGFNLSADESLRLLRREAWYISYSDSDTV